MIDRWCKSTGVTRAELARILELDRSATSRMFAGERRMLYDEAETILDYLAQRLSPLPKESVRSLAVRRRDLEKARTSETVAQVVSKLLKGNFTQVPVFDVGDNFKGFVTDGMIVERLLNPNVKFRGKWTDKLRSMTVKEADIIETSAVYPVEASISSVANALRHFYAVMLSENDRPSTIVTRFCVG